MYKKGPLFLQNSETALSHTSEFISVHSNVPSKVITHRSSYIWYSGSESIFSLPKRFRAYTKGFNCLPFVSESIITRQNLSPGTLNLPPLRFQSPQQAVCPPCLISSDPPRPCISSGVGANVCLASSHLFPA